MCGWAVSSQYQSLSGLARGFSSSVDQELVESKRLSLDYGKTLNLVLTFKLGFSFENLLNLYATWELFINGIKIPF